MTSLSQIVSDQVSLEIIEIFNKNKISDLKKFMLDRENLNYYNSYLSYLFHIIQTSGVLLTSLSASNNNQYLLWSGISLNMFAQLILIFEKINDSKLKKRMNDIKSIKEGTYIDDSPLVDVDKDVVSDKSNTSINNKKMYNTFQADSETITLLNNDV
jgi:hypothetical protein